MFGLFKNNKPEVQEAVYLAIRKDEKRTKDRLDFDEECEKDVEISGITIREIFKALNEISEDAEYFDTQGRIKGISCHIGDYLITLSISPFLTDSTVRISARHIDSFINLNYYSTR